MVPLKFWRKKPVNEYNLIFYDDIDKDVYVFKSFGKSMKRSVEGFSACFTVVILSDNFDSLLT